MSDLIGQGTAIDDLLADYFLPGSRAGRIGQLVEDEQTLLQAALLMEARGERVETTSNSDEVGTYWTERLEVDQQGPTDDALTNDAGAIDFGFVASSVDIRPMLSGDSVGTVEVAFKPPARANRWVPYRTDSIVTDIPAQSRYMWVRCDPNGETLTADVQVEAWA